MKTTKIEYQVQTRLPKGPWLNLSLPMKEREAIKWMETENPRRHRAVKITTVTEVLK